MAGIEYKIKISVEELMTNNNWEDLIQAHIDNAKDSLTYEIFLNGEVHISSYIKEKEVLATITSPHDTPTP